MGGATAPTHAVLWVLAALLIGCGGSELGTAGIARSIAKSILDQRHLYAKVECPPHVQIEKGREFTCVARLKAGTYPVKVTVVDDKGNVRWANTAPLVALNVSNVESAIRHSIRDQRDLHASVHCPTPVLQKKGVNFRCQAIVNGKKSSFAVTQIDDSGHVTFVGL